VPAGRLINMTETAEFLATDGQAHDQLGIGVNVDVGMVVAGAWQDDSAGSAYVFQSHGAQTSGIERPDTWGRCRVAGGWFHHGGDTVADERRVPAGCCDPRRRTELGGHAPAAQEAFVNDGALSQTLPVNNARVDFYVASDKPIRQYRGVTIDTTTTRAKLARHRCRARKEPDDDCALAWGSVLTRNAATPSWHRPGPGWCGCGAGRRAWDIARAPGRLPLRARSRVVTAATKRLADVDGDYVYAVALTPDWEFQVGGHHRAG
jgi:hypothetical protein